jgi:type I restriction enzyme, S subunit
LNVHQRVPLWEVAPAQSARVERPRAGPVWSLGLEHIESGSGVILARNVVEPEDLGSSTHAFTDQHVLYSKLRPNLNKVALPDTGGWCTTELLPLKPDPARLDRGYLAHYLKSFEFVSWATSRTDGAKMPRVKMDELRTHRIPLPSLHEQQRIAALLDRADAIRRKRREALSLANDFLRCAFLDISQEIRNGTIAGEIKQIGSLLSEDNNPIRTGPFGSDLLHSEFTAQGVPVLGIENVVTNRFRWTEPRCISFDKYQSLKRFRVFPQDVIVTIMGTTGRVCIAPADLPECISTKHLCVLTPDKSKVSSLYLWASLLFDPVVRKQAAQAGKGAIMEGWNMSIVRELEIAVPTHQALERFDATAKRAESLRERHEALELESEQLFGSLSSRAFNGELTS